MEYKDLLTIIVTILLVVGGWAAVHFLSLRREIEQKKREIRVQYLKDAYIKLAEAVDRGSIVDNIKDIQESFNVIQIFGDESQIELIGNFIEEATAGGSPSIDELLKELRNEIRQHIGLEPIDGYRWHIRLDKEETLH
ncbi:MAG: hypothetical protein U9Q37_02355 [Euryarchaeota archaeon]|nr:hypothetical protein [Euryarchaeota archaeon]